MSRPKVIVNADPDDYHLVARVVKIVTAPSYHWSDDGIACISFHSQGQEVWEGMQFGVRRNKTSITIYGPDKEKAS